MSSKSLNIATTNITFMYNSKKYDKDTVLNKLKLLLLVSLCSLVTTTSASEDLSPAMQEIKLHNNTYRGEVEKERSHNLKNRDERIREREYTRKLEAISKK